MFECVQICTVSDTLPALQRLPPVRSARRGLSGIECRPVQRAHRPGVCVVPFVVCLSSGAACPDACDVQSVRVRWGAGVSTGGVYRKRRGWGGSIVSVEKFQKRRFSCLPTPSFLLKSPPPLLPISKIPRKNKKTPTNGLCSVLYLPYKP